jgi:hypothetical protein
MKKYKLSTRQQKLNYIIALRNECNSIIEHLFLVESSIKRLTNDIKMDDFITFCQTGVYPND